MSLLFFFRRAGTVVRRGPECLHFAAKSVVSQWYCALKRGSKWRHYDQYLCFVCIVRCLWPL